VRAASAANKYSRSSGGVGERGRGAGAGA